MASCLSVAPFGQRITFIVGILQVWSIGRLRLAKRHFGPGRAGCVVPLHTVSPRFSSLRGAGANKTGIEAIEKHTACWYAGLPLALERRWSGQEVGYG